MLETTAFSVTPGVDDLGQPSFTTSYSIRNATAGTSFTVTLTVYTPNGKVAEKHSETVTV